MSVNTTAPTITPGSAADSAVVNAVLDGIQAPWDSYTPVVTGSTTNPGAPSLVEGAYMRIGKTVHFRMRVEWTGSPGNGSGTYLFSLPFPTGPGGTSADAVGHGAGYQSASSIMQVTALAGTGSSNCVLHGTWTNGTSSSAGAVGSSFGAANSGYSFRISGTYECA